MTEITAVDAWEVLDSRGLPTVRVEVRAADHAGVFTVPAGASTGRFEAVDAVADELAPVVVGRDVTEQLAIDDALVERDGIESLARLGANAVLGVSGAVAHAASEACGLELYEYLAQKRSSTPPSGSTPRGAAAGQMPMPMVNVLSGGLHARGGIEVQDFLVVPVGADTSPEALELAWTVRDAVRARIVEDGHRPLVADEGGFAPPLDAPEDGFALLESCVERAGYVPGNEIAFAVDVAATHFYDEQAGTYDLSSVGRSLDRDGMIELVGDWVDAYPIASVEDPLAEDDWNGWERMSIRLGSGVQLLGDDFLVTDADRLRRAHDRDAAGAVLVKPNQAGTVSRAIDVIETAQYLDRAPVVSARSGETADATIADLAVGLDAGQIKIGSLARSERLAKYNRLLEIERAGDERPLARPFGRGRATRCVTPQPALGSLPVERATTAGSP